MKQRTLPFDVKAGEGPLCIDTRTLADSINEALSSEMPAVREAAELALQEVFDTTKIIFGSEKDVYKLRFFNDLCTIFSHGCYEEDWFLKSGGSLGINLLITKVNMGDAWIQDKLLDLFRALMYVIKDMPFDLPAKTRRGAQDTLEILLRRCMKSTSKEDLKAPTQQHVRPTKLYQLCSILNGELSHMNPHVRKATKQALEIISTSLDVEIHELLEPTKDRWLAAIYNKPLRALPFAVQIGFIDAVTYYMNVKEGFVPLDEPANRLLMEALALADAPDESLASKPAEQRTHESIINLRVVCIKILTSQCNTNEDRFGVLQVPVLRVHADHRSSKRRSEGSPFTYDKTAKRPSSEWFASCISQPARSSQTQHAWSGWSCTFVAASDHILQG
jgi:transformation/transcription domain-associated protein